LCLLAFSEWTDHRAASRDLVELGSATGLARRHPDAVANALRERDVVRGRLRLAEMILAEQADRRWLGELDVAELRMEIDALPTNLALATEAARQVHALRPTTWSAPMIIGGLQYLERYYGTDARLFTERATWEVPLRRSLDLAPGHSEAWTMACTAYLGVWRSLTDDERSRLISLVKDCFADPADFRRLAPQWLASARDDDQALAVIPNEAEAWKLVATWYRRQARWDEWHAADAHRRILVTDGLMSDLDQALKLRRGGAGRDAARLIHASITRAPVDLSLAQLIGEMIDISPGGSPTEAQARGIRRHLDSALAHCVRGRCPYSPEQLDRLALWSRADDEPTIAAILRLTHGELGQADTLVRRARAPLNTDEWAPYLVLRARTLARRDRRDEALATLEQLASGARNWAVAQALAAEIDPAGRGHDAGALAWPPHHWRWRHGIAFLDLLVNRPGTGLRLEIDGFDNSVPIEIRWDGRLQLVAVVTGASTVEVDLDVTADLHLLTVETLGRQPVIPRAVHLVPGQDLSASIAGDEPHSP